MLDVVTLNTKQADDFLKKYFQDKVYVLDISKDDEDGIYFVKLLSGKGFFGKIYTSWQYRPGIGLCFGEHRVRGTNKRFDIYKHTDGLLDHANEIVRKKITKWNSESPV